MAYTGSIDMIGQRFGRWTVIERAENSKGNRSPRWLCRCDCGATHIRYGYSLRSGDSTGCRACATRTPKPEQAPAPRPKPAKRKPAPAPEPPKQSAPPISTVRPLDSTPIQYARPSSIGRQSTQPGICKYCKGEADNPNAIACVPCAIKYANSKFPYEELSKQIQGEANLAKRRKGAA